MGSSVGKVYDDSEVTVGESPVKEYSDSDVSVTKDSSPSGASQLFDQPEIQKRSDFEALQKNFGVQDVLSLLRKPTMNPSDLASPMAMLGKPEIANTMAQTPAGAAINEGLQREEAVFANILRSVANGKASPIDLIQSGGKAISGKELSTLGNFFEDIGFDDFSSASAGLLASMFLPSSIIGSNILKESSAISKSSKPIDTFIHDIKGPKGFFSEVSSKMTGVPKEDFETIFTRGAQETFSEPYDVLLPKKISQKISDGLNAVRDRAGREVQRVKSELKLSGRELSTERISSQMDESLKKFGFNKDRKFLVEESGLKSDMEDLFKIKEKIDGSKKLSLSELMDYRDELGEMSYSGFRRGGEKIVSKPTEKADAVLRAWRNHITKQIHDIAPELTSVDRNFVIASSLRERGAKFFDDVSRGEKVLAQLDKESLPVKDKLLIKRVVKRISGTEDWIDSVRMNLTRKNFNNILPKGVMQRLVGGVALGVGGAFGSPVAATVGLMTSPVAVKQLLIAAEGGGKLLNSLIGSVKSASARKALEQFTNKR